MNANESNPRVSFWLRLKTKLMISYILLIVVIIGLYISFTFASINNTSSEQLQQAAGHVFEQTRELLDYKFDNIAQASDRLFYDANLNDLLKRIQTSSVTPEVLDEVASLRSILSSAYKSSDMYALMIYLDNSVYASDMPRITVINRTAFVKMGSAEKADWYAELDRQRDRRILINTISEYPASGSRAEIISSIRYLKKMEDFRSVLGILRIDVLRQDIIDIVTNAVPTDNSVAYILNDSGEIMAASNMQWSESFCLDPNTLDNLRKSEDCWAKMVIDNKDMLVSSARVAHTDWTLVSMLPQEDVRVAGWHIIRATIPMLVVSVLLAILLSIALSHAFTRRINHLSLKMMSIRSHALPECMEETGRDEVSMLIRSYNHMIMRIQNYSKTQYKLGRDVKSAEYKALQAQIAPHFLYNTLELINWVALRNNVPEISNIVQDLARYYKLSLSRGRDTISIEDAIAHMRIYISLQNFRFKDKLTLNVEVDSELYGYSILNLIIQPLVENAILHGIFETESQVGTITIGGEKQGDTIVLTVSDDGVGMDEKTVELLFKGTGEGNHSYGITNVDNRLKLYYGNEYGLACHSVLGKGTTVSVFFPAVLIK